jgi:hypothetical protein
MSLIARALTPDASASCSIVKPAARRNALKWSPNAGVSLPALDSLARVDSLRMLRHVA